MNTDFYCRNRNKNFVWLRTEKTVCYEIKAYGQSVDATNVAEHKWN